ncbi:hypothetical protein D6D29_10473 [Aureobasidium pullulans]|nr:hypothetical protein D6D29_10473 [Aureobasidium pullulans]
MARTNKMEPLSWLCFALTGEPHKDCVNDPFQNDAGIWIRFGNSPDKRYNGAMPFREVLVQAKQNLIKAHQAMLDRERAAWLEVFPRVTTRVKQDVNEQLQLDKPAFKKAHLCKKISEPLQIEWLSITTGAPEATQSTQGFASRSHIDESPVAGSQYDTGKGPTKASTAALTTHDVDMLEGSMPSTNDTGEAEAEEELQSPNTSTTYGVDMLEGSMPDTGSTEADQEVQSSHIFAPDSTSDEYEEMVSSAVLDHGMEVLSTTEGKAFMGNMGRAMVRGYREGLCRAYAALRTCMAAYGRRSELEDEHEGGD